MSLAFKVSAIDELMFSHQSTYFERKRANGADIINGPNERDGAFGHVTIRGLLRALNERTAARFFDRLKTHSPIFKKPTQDHANTTRAGLAG